MHETALPHLDGGRSVPPTFTAGVFRRPVRRPRPSPLGEDAARLAPGQALMHHPRTGFAEE